MPDSDPDKSELRGDDSMAVSPCATNQDQNGHQNLVKYGELVILGYNGQLPQGKSFVLLEPSDYCRWDHQ
jgi:hypothetical protein